MKNIKDLEQKISELEYRLGVLEKFLDLSSPLFHKDDESTMNAIRIEVVQNMEKQGYQTEEVRKRLGIGFYNKE